MGWFIISRALVVRVMFALHGFLTIWLLTVVSHDSNHWYAIASLTGLLLETIFTIYVRKGQEWKWFCPSVLFFLLSVVPPIWLWELHEMEGRIREEMIRQNASHNLLNATSDEEIAEMLAKMRIPIQIQIDLTSEQIVRLLEQLLLLLLILGRWILPKGELTHDQLSELLLVYIATAADIVEFFDAFKEEAVKFNRPLCVVILSIWSWSLLQFTMVLTATKKNKEPAPKSLLGIQQGLYSTFKSAPKRHHRSPATTPMTPLTPRTLYQNVEGPPQLKQPKGLHVVSPSSDRKHDLSDIAKNSQIDANKDLKDGRKGQDNENPEVKVSKKYVNPKKDDKKSFLINFSDDDDDDDEDDDDDDNESEEVDDDDSKIIKQEQHVKQTLDIKTSHKLQPKLTLQQPPSSPSPGSILKPHFLNKKRNQTPLANPLLQRGPPRTLLLSPISARGFPRLSPVDPKSSQRKEAAIQMEPCCTPEVYGILISMFLQDAPFLVLRLLLIFQYDVFSYTNMFFTCKNTLVCMLLTYRLAVIQIERCQPVWEEKRRRRKCAKEQRDSGALSGLVLAMGGPSGKSGGSKKIKDAADLYYRYSTKVNLREYKGSTIRQKSAPASNTGNIDYTIHEGYQPHPLDSNPMALPQTNGDDVEDDDYYYNYYRNCCMLSASDADISLTSAPDRMNIDAIYELY